MATKQRIYSKKEIRSFLEEDKIDAKLAGVIGKLLKNRNNRISKINHQGRD